MAGVTWQTAALESGWQGVTKRCHLSWLTNKALIYKSQSRGIRGGIAGSQPMTTAEHIK
jgi:hypothetical protein